jgi:AhpD family alkylhydroperoxidase
MSPRLHPHSVLPDAFTPLRQIEAQIKAGDLEPVLIELVKVRASQINGCGYCLHLHTSAALAVGEDAARLFLLNAWRESGMYTPRERAALGWTEALTLLAESGAPDDAYAAVAEQFSDAEIVHLTLLIGTINTWNRIAVGFRMVHPNEKGRAAR